MSSINSAVDNPSQTDDLSNKRKRQVEDLGDREQKKVHVEDSRLSIDDLHLDVGEKYLLCRTPHPVMRPHLSEDLFARYGLDDIAASVARVKDGKKNVIRKTYKNYIKNLGISGAFDVDKKESREDPSSLWSMMRLPEEEWNAQFVRGREIEKGLPPAIMSSLGKALTMSKGTLKKEQWNSSVLGELSVIPSTADPTKAASKVAPKVRTPMPSGSMNPAVPRPTKGEAVRPKRKTTRTAYDDTSFEGYGEGFVDDDLQDAGYSTGDGDEKRARKRAKKTPTNQFQAPMHQSYGPGMVGA